jgi:hypothetical protein
MQVAQVVDSDGVVQLQDQTQVVQVTEAVTVETLVQHHNNFMVLHLVVQMVLAKMVAVQVWAVQAVKEQQAQE